MYLNLVFNLARLFALLVFVVACSDSSAVEELGVEAPQDSPSLTLREKGAFAVGTAVSATAIRTDASYEQILRTHFSQITAEGTMKMEAVWESVDSYNWEETDYLMDYAEVNNMSVHGHTLVWYKRFPQWFVKADYDSIAFEARVKDYITHVVSRYKGRIRSWDVVNEAFADGGGLRDESVVKTVFQDPIGFYGRCFQYVRAADPDALLFYNDYNVVLDTGKRNAIKEMIARFNEQDMPIDGIGDQFHYMQSTNKNQIKTGLQDMASTGLRIHISELDIRMNVNQSDEYVFTSKQEELQADTYQSIVAMYEALPQDQKFAITTWGLSDKQSWLLDWWHEKEYPLLFDRNYNPKKAYNGFLRGLR